MEDPKHQEHKLKQAKKLMACADEVIFCENINL
jgi:hypothetical protein